VTLDAAEVDKYYQQVYRDYANQIKVPGFRKGKVPANIVRNYVGKENVSGAAEEQIKEHAIDDGLTQLKLTPRQGRVTWVQEPDPEEGQPITYEFSVPVLGISEEMKQRYRERLIEKYSEYPEKQGAAEKDDALLISFNSAYAEGGEETPLKHEGLLYVLGREGNMPGWDEKLTGLKAGDSVDFDYLVPENFADKRVATKLVKLHIGVQTVNSIVVPELNEQFVKDTLHMESMAQFDEYLLLSLQRERDAQVEQIKRDLVMQKLAADIVADITEDMVSDEIDGLVKENDRTLRQYDSSLDQYLQGKGQALQDYRESLREAALTKIRLFLAVKTIADTESIFAASEDFQRYASYLMQYEGIPLEQMRELMKHREFYTEAAYQIVREKVFEHVVASATFNPEPLSTGSEPAESADAAPADEAGNS
jgi:trigger factor